MRYRAKQATFPESSEIARETTKIDSSKRAPGEESTPLPSSHEYDTSIATLVSPFRDQEASEVERAVDQIRDNG
jgi:hypothetical protein